MTRTMYDAVTLANIRPDATMVGCYVDGAYANVAEARTRFPSARLVTITVNGRNKAHVVDVEPGDCTPASGVAAVKAGTVATVYCSASVVAQVCSEFITQGVPRDTPIWSAHYTGTPHLCGPSCYGPVPFTPNIVATQYAGDVAPGIDISLVADYWPGVDPAPEGDDMTPDECRAVVHEELQYLLGAIEGQPNSKFRQSPVANLLKMQTTLEAIAAKLGIKP